MESLLEAWDCLTCFCVVLLLLWVRKNNMFCFFCLFLFEMCFVHVCSLAFSCFRNLFRERVKMTGLRRLFLESAVVQVGHWLACGSLCLGVLPLRGPCTCPGREWICRETSGSLVPGHSLSACLKHNAIWGKVSRQQLFPFQVHSKPWGLTAQ